MAYRFIFSQMFDVRPRNSLGELDLEKIKKIEKFTNLRIGERSNINQRIINLKSFARHLEVIGDNIFEDNKENYILDQKSRRYFANDFLETSTPEQSELFYILEAIESADQFLKKQTALEEIGTIPDSEIVIRKAMQEPQIIETIVDFQGTPKTKEEEIILEPQAEDSQGQLSDGPAAFYPERICEEVSFFDSGISPFYQEPELYTLREYREKSSVPSSKKRKTIAVFSLIAFLIFSLAPLFSWFNNLTVAKANVLSSSTAAYQAMISAKESLGQADFSQAEKKFQEANYLFSSANSQIDRVGRWLVFVLEKIPGFSFFSSRTNLIRAGENLSKSGENFIKAINLFEKNKIDFSKNNNNQPLSAIMNQGKDYLQSALISLTSANKNLQKVEVSSLPGEAQDQISDLKNKIPQAIIITSGMIGWTDNFLDIIGNQKAKKYLLVFQNNSEMRATGGFIGTYGVLDIDQGQIKNIFIDGVFNADGQLIEKVVPPRPIQKISTAWSMHDANWFADFPTSAQKIMWFFEKTGGPTVDGVISLTPTVIERLLSLTGPIDMPEYGVSLNKDNFTDLTQQKIEVEYDKELNQPKKILADFTPKFIEAIGQKMKENSFDILNILNRSLIEKHVLVYFSESDLEDFVQKQGWGGEIKKAEKDYFSVVNSNINGFKTDRVIEQKITYFSEIQKDGSIIDTLKIYRHHQGGNSNYDWYNKVNADYLKVYLPKGSQLISAEGQTVEEYKPPIDYREQGFKLDQDVSFSEKILKIDEDTGTQIFEESDKTVFGNWVFVSPGETSVLTYRYKLPFKIDILKLNDNFSLFVQKQSGMINSFFEARISFPESWELTQSNQGSPEPDNHSIKIETDLAIDRSLEFVFKIKNEK